MSTMLLTDASPGCPCAGPAATSIPATRHPFLGRPGLGATQVKVWRAVADLCGGDPAVPVSIYAIAERTGLSPEAVKAAIRRLRYRARNHPAAFSWPYQTHERDRPASARRSRTKAAPPVSVGPAPIGEYAPDRVHAKPAGTPLAVAVAKDLAQWRDLMQRRYGPAWRQRARGGAV